LCIPSSPFLSFPLLGAGHLNTMSFSPATIPEISISPAPPVEAIIEPYSPFASIKYPDDDDGFRSRLLTPPPSSSFGTRSTPSSSGSVGYDSDEERFDYNEGLDSNRFEALLQATRERNARKGSDLRREVTLRAHRTKQIERRARFITRVLAGPLTVAANSLAPPPCVLPSSPKVVPTFSKPSPLSLHNVNEEQFDIHEEESFNLSPVTASPAGRGNALPSLEEIRTRLMSKQRPEGNPTLPPCAEYMDLKVPQPRLSNRLSLISQPANETRASRSQDMLCALRRRTLPSNGDEEDKKWKRHSAPGDLFPSQTRVGFQHPVLSMPGGF